jgi:pimeloyl-ACP methyl ester carboxylesterase
VKLYYEEAGTGTPIVFVHEFATDHRGWEPQMRFFTRGAIRRPTCRPISTPMARRSRPATSPM